MGSRYNWAVIIQEIQDKLFLSQEQIADAFHISQQSISAWKNGSRTPNPALATRILEFAGKHGIKIEQEYAGTDIREIERFLRSGGGREFMRLMKLYGRMTKTGRKKLLECAEKLGRYQYFDK